MSEYYNYSPEIPTGDENPEIQQHDNKQQPQQDETPVKRRNPGKRHREAVNAAIDKKESTTKVPSEAKHPEKESILSQVKEWISSTVTRSVVGILLGGLGFWFAVAFVSYFSTCIADQSAVMSAPAGMASGIDNDAGEGGARITEFLINQGFGVGAIVLVVWLLCMSLKLLIGYPRFRTLDFSIKSLVALITLSVVIGMLSIGLDTDVNWGGFHGRYINEKIYEFIGWSGAIILSVVLVAIFVVICLRDVIKWLLKKKHIYDEKRRIQQAAIDAEMQKEAEIKEMERQEHRDQALSGEGEAVETADVTTSHVSADNVKFDPDADTIFDIPDLEDEEEDSWTDMEAIASADPNGLDIWEEPIEYMPPSEAENASKEEVEPAASDNSFNSDKADIGNNVPDEAVSPDEEEGRVEKSVEEEHVNNQAFVSVENSGETLIDPYTAVTEESSSESSSSMSDQKVYKVEKEEEYAEEDSSGFEDSLEPKEDIMTVNVNQIEKGSTTSSTSYDTGLFTHEYRFPSTDYLRAGDDRIAVDADEQMENKEKIKKTLLDFGIPITSIEATVGPTVTLYEIRPDTGVKIARIRNLADDLALSLAAKGIRIIAPIPGKGTVGIEVANKTPRTVSMRTIIQSKSYQESKYYLPVALGSTISNDVYIADLAKMPHLLVAGATGQGKSVGLNAIVTSLLYSKRPEELKFVMVDPKRVEFSLYSKIENYYLAKIPNSPQPIITNMENVVATLSSLCVEMDERYKLLEKAFVRQVIEYNDKFKAKKLDPREGHRFMPYIVVIIDEFADLIMTAGKEVELPIARLAQLARAVGIHVIIATQRPSTNVITGMIKANFPVRIAFKVSSGVDSKTILDSTGAQQLIGRGDMLISNNGEMIRVQCAFVDTPEVEEVCDYIARQPYPQGPYILPEPQVGGEGDAPEADPVNMGKKDPLLEDVARQVVMSGTASTSAVQRRYEIGYNRAGRIMDQLEALGVVGPATGGKPRNVLVDAMTLEDILSTLG